MIKKLYLSALAKSPLRLNTFLFIIALAMIGYLTPSRFTYTATRSLNYRLFFLDRAVESYQISNGSYILFTMRSPYLPKGEAMVVKQVVCPSGSHLRAQQNHFFCNGIFLGKAKDFTRQGLKTTVFNYDGLIPERQFFVMGVHKDSLDSRYVGLINENNIIALAYPVI